MTAAGADAVRSLERVVAEDLPAVTAFLRAADLTVSGLGHPSVRLWVQRDAEGAVVASTGYELAASGRDALVRSVAVDARHRARGRGSALATFALAEAASEGARRAWLFSRRSGPFWQGLGFEPADREELAEVLADTQQVQLFRASAQLAREVAWSRSLEAVADALSGEVSRDI